MKKILTVLAITLTVLLIALVFHLNTLWNKISIRADSSHNTPFIFDPHNQMATQLEQKKPINILLLGYGGGTHDGAYLTDSIMDIQIDPAKKSVALISIPRDIWLSLPTSAQGSTYWKINDAYVIGLNDKDFPDKAAQYKGATGAATMAKYAVAEVTGLQPDRLVAIDFAGFRRGIDAVGGVDITVNPAFDDPEYPIDGKENDTCGFTAAEFRQHEQMASIDPVAAFPCRYEHLHFAAGLQHMDGTTALKYVRSRHSDQDGSDFGRAKRQQNLVEAIKQKLFNVSFIPQLLPFMDSLSSSIKTDMSLSELQSLINDSNSLKGYAIKNIVLTDANVLQDSTSETGGAILIPKDGMDQWNEVHDWIGQQIGN